MQGDFYIVKYDNILIGTIKHVMCRQRIPIFFKNANLFFEKKMTDGFFVLSLSYKLLIRLFPDS